MTSGFCWRLKHARMEEFQASNMKILVNFRGLNSEFMGGCNLSPVAHAKGCTHSCFNNALFVAVVCCAYTTKAKTRLYHVTL